MPEIKVQCPECKVTVRLAALPAGKSAITCPKCKGRVPLTDEPPPPRPPRPARPRRRRDGKGEWDALVPDTKPDLEKYFGSELWGAIGFVGFGIILMILCFVGGTISTAAVWGLGISVFALALWGSIWLLIIAFGEDPMCGLMTLLVPFYSLYYVISRFGDCYRALIVEAGAFVVCILFIIGAIGAGVSAKRDRVEEVKEQARAHQQADFGKSSQANQSDARFIDLALEDLRSPNSVHRHRAALKLADMQPTSRRREVAKALSEIVEDQSVHVRALSVAALAVWGDWKLDHAVFLKALRDPDAGVAAAALEIVKREKDDRAIEPLIDALPKLGEAAAKVLRAYGDRAEQALVAATSHRNPAIRKRATELLAEMGSGEMVTVMLTGLKGMDRIARERSVDYFCRTVEPRAVEGLVRCLPDRALGRKALDALRKQGPAAEAEVLEHLKRLEPVARRQVLPLFEDIGTKDSVAALRDILLEEGPDKDLARDALKAIAKKFPADFPADKPPIWEVDLVTRALADWDSGDNHKRARALEALARSAPTPRRDEVVKLLQPALKDNDLQTRRLVIETYGRWAGPEGVPTLIKLLSEDEVTTRHAVIAVLGKLKDERAISALALLLPQDRDRGEAVKALRQFGVKAQLEVSKYCTHADGGTRQEATKLLGAIGDKEAVPALQKLITQKQDKRLSDVATQAMAELKARLAAEDEEK